MLDQLPPQTLLFDSIEARSVEDRQRLEQTPAIARCLAGRVEMSTYRAFLQEAYHHVKHTVPLLMACGSRLPERLEWLRAALAHYIEEEIGHQEWILNDLEQLGVDKEQVRNGRPAPATELMVSYAYDSVQRGNPLSLFGMIYVLEKTSATIATHAAGQIAKTLDLPEQAMSYLYSHGSLDVEHMRHFEKQVNRLVDGADRDAILHAVSMFYPLYTAIFEALPVSDLDSAEKYHAA